MGAPSYEEEELVAYAGPLYRQLGTKVQFPSVEMTIGVHRRERFGGFTNVHVVSIILLCRKAWTLRRTGSVREIQMQKAPLRNGGYPSHA